MGSSIKQIAKLLGDKDLLETIAYAPYKFTDNKVLFGAPPTPLIGLDFITARHLNPQRKRFQCLTGRGVFASNINTAGVIEVGIMTGSLSQGLIEVMQATGIPYPIIIQDISSGGTSSVIATACQLVETPEWKRELMTGVTVYTFESARLFINHGIKLPLIVN